MQRHGISTDLYFPFLFLFKWQPRDGAAILIKSDFWRCRVDVRPMSWDSVEGSLIVEDEPLPPCSVVKPSVVVRQIAVDISPDDAMVECVPFKRRPSAFAHNVLLRERPVLGGYKGDVCAVAFADESSLVDVEEPGRGVAHLLDDFRLADDTLCREVEHRDE